MEMTTEVENLFRARKVINDDLLPLLRKFFKYKWDDEKDANEPAWSDSRSDGEALIMKRSKKKDNPRFTIQNEEKIKSGSTKYWDANCLCQAIFTLNVTENEKSSINTLVGLRNMVFHRSQGILSVQEKDDFFRTIKDEFRKLSWSIDNVNKIETDPITTDEMERLRSKLESERMKGKVLITTLRRVHGVNNRF